MFFSLLLLFGAGGVGCLGFCFLAVLGGVFFFEWFPFYVPIDSRYSLFSLFWPLHLKWPSEACQKCSPSY